MEYRLFSNSATTSKIKSIITIELSWNLTYVSTKNTYIYIFLKNLIYNACVYRTRPLITMPEEIHVSVYILYNDNPESVYTRAKVFEATDWQQHAWKIIRLTFSISSGERMAVIKPINYTKSFSIPLIKRI